MEENLESFVTLLNKHRQARPASEDLAHLPDWARRALSKSPDQSSSAPPRLQPVNGKSEAKSKSEIVLAPAGMTPVPAEPPAARAPEAREPKTLLANLLTKGGERSPSRRRAPIPATPIPLDEPSRLIEKSIAALTAPRDATPPKKCDLPVAATIKGAEPGQPTIAAVEAAPPVVAAVEPPPSIASVEAEPPVAAAVEPPPSIASAETAPLVVAAVEPPPSIASVEAAPVVVAAVEPSPARPENLEPGKADPITIAPTLFDQILTGRIGGMTPLPAMIGEMPVPTESPPLSADAEALPSLPAIVATMPASSGRRPLAYALAAAAVIGVVALVGAGGYWYARAPGHGVASRVVKIEPVAPAPRVAAAAVPVAPNPARPASTVTKPTVTTTTVINGSPPTLAAAPQKPPPANPAIAMATPVPVVSDKAGSEKAAADLITDAKPERAAAPATPPPLPAEPKHAATAIPDEKPAAIAKTPSVVPPPPSVQEAKASATKVAAAAPEISATSQAITATRPSLGSDTAPASPVATATVESRAPVKEVPAQFAMLTSSPALVVPTSTRIEPAPVPGLNQAMYNPDANPGMKGEPTWLRNAVSAPPFTGAPRIAIVIDDLGLDRNRTDRAIALKGPVTLSFLAYASDLRAQTDEARRAGHELIVHVPMEPIMRPKYITKTATGEGFARDELLRRLRWDLNRFDGYVGVSNHMGNQSGGDLDTTRTVIGELKARGLLFLDARVDGGASNVAERVGVPTVSRDVLLDDDINATAISLRLAEVEKIARQRGTAVAVGHPHEQTLEALAVWLAGFPSRGLQLVPLTAIVKDREQHLAGAN